MTAEALKIKAQDGIRGLEAINNSPTANYWSEDTNLENWAKTVWGNNRTKNKHPAYVKHTVYTRSSNVTWNCKVMKKERSTEYVSKQKKTSRKHNSEEEETINTVQLHRFPVPLSVPFPILPCPYFNMLWLSNKY